MMRIKAPFEIDAELRRGRYRFLGWRYVLWAITLNYRNCEGWLFDVGKDRRPE